MCNLALKLLETCMLNCGMTFHQVVVETGLLADLVALTDTKRKLDRDLRNKILQQLETWGTGISIPLEYVRRRPQPQRPPPPRIPPARTTARGSHLASSSPGLHLPGLLPYPPPSRRRD